LGYLLEQKNNPVSGILIFDFIEHLLTMAHPDDYSVNIRRRVSQFMLKYTAPDGHWIIGRIQW
jgi:hypothetical protein